jgi:hypothetical protein
VPVTAGCTDNGNHLLFGDASGGTDVVFDADRTAVLALDFHQHAPDVLALSLDGHAFTFAFGVTTFAYAQSQLSVVADVSGAGWAAYRVNAQQMLVAQFDPASGTLRRLTIGRPTTLRRLDILPAAVNDAPFDYIPPRLRGALPLQQRAALGAARGTIVRIDVDRYGIARHVALIIPSGDAAFDATLIARFGDAGFAPATLAGRAVASSDFELVRH